MNHSATLANEFRLRAANIAERLETEPHDTVQAVNAAMRDVFDPYVAGQRPLDAVRLHLATLATSTRYFPTADDMQRRRGTAFHEAGHAAVAYALGVRFTKVTIEPTLDGSALGFVHLAQSHQTGGARTDLERLDVERYCIIDLAGPAAEDEGDTPAPRETWDVHRKDVRRILLEIRPALSEAALRSLADFLEHRARGLVRDTWPAITALVELLETKHTIDGSEARATIAAALDGPPIVTEPAPVHNFEDIAQ